MKKGLKEEVLNLLKERHGITAEESDLLKNDLNMDSLDRVEFAIRLEQKFNIHISDEEADRFAGMSVGDVINLVDSKLF